MRAKAWFGPATAALLGGALVAGCAAPRQPAEGIVETGDGLFSLSLRGASPAAAVERGLNLASQHCADRNRMISVQSSRIERDGYRLAFRCLAVPGGVPVAEGPAPAAAPSSPASPSLPASPAPTEAALPPASLPPAAAPASRPVSPAGTPLPLASSALPPIAGGGLSGGGAATRPSGGLAPSSFWQTGR